MPLLNVKIGQYVAITMCNKSNACCPSNNREKKEVDHHMKV